MKFSTKSSYGLRACVALAHLYSKGEPVSTTILSKENHIPHRFLEQILSSLRQAGLVLSQRGTKGGYRLAQKPEEITIHAIVTAMEGEIGPLLCSVPENREGDCCEKGHCYSYDFCQKLEGKLKDVLQTTTLKDLTKEGTFEVLRGSFSS